MDVQKTLARHCSSVLLRKKPSALFSLPHASLRSEEWIQALRHYALDHKVLCERCDHALVLVYDSAMLQRLLDSEAIRQSLNRLGYRMEQPLEMALEHLRRRVSDTGGDFPHEIGFFLGYPEEDVLGFMRHKGKHCKHCGLWKVYGDVPRAMAMFEELHACKRRVLHHLESGGSLYDLPSEWAV